MTCSRCGTEGPLYTRDQLCHDCRIADAEKRIAGYRPGPPIKPKHQRLRRVRTHYTISHRNPDHAAPGEEF